MATFNYDIADGNQSFTGVDGADTLNITGGISDRNLSFLQDGNNFLIETEAGTTITITNHFVDNNSRIEFLNIAGAGTIDLSSMNVVVNNGDIALLGTNANDLILGGINNRNGKGNNINGNAGDDIIYAGAGDSSINTGSGDDIAYGGTGNDRFIDTGTGDDFYDGGDGTDRLDYTSSSTGITIDLAAGTTDQNNDSVINDTFINIENADGSNASAGDTLYGNSANNVLKGYSGDDTLYGRDGNDTLDGGLDDDTAYGGNGDDHFKDTEGTNSFYGEDGNDIFTLPNTVSTSTTNTIDGGNGTDLVTYFGNGVGVVADLSLGTVDKTGNSVTDDTLTSIENLYGTKHDDIITGSAADNLFIAHHGDDTVYGGNGNDTIYGRNDNDTLYGESGFDLLFGESGDDTLYGSDGSDRLNGGSGDDIFIFEDLGDYSGDLYNIIEDLNPNEDIIDISAIIDDIVALPFVPITTYLQAVDDGTNTTIRIDNTGLGLNFNDTIQLEGYTGHGDNVQDMINEGYLVV